MKAIIILSLILLFFVGIIVYQMFEIKNTDDKAVATIQYSAPIGPKQDGSILPSEYILNNEVQK